MLNPSGVQKQRHMFSHPYASGNVRKREGEAASMPPQYSPPHPSFHANAQQATVTQLSPAPFTSRITGHG